jgi:hypothetical protein
VLRHTGSTNTDFKRAPYKRPILGNLTKAAKVMPYTDGKPKFQRFFWYMSLKRRRPA